jgi:hypothetical protein
MTDEERDLLREERVARTLRRRLPDGAVPPFSAIEARLERRTSFSIQVVAAVALIVLALAVGAALADRRGAVVAPPPATQAPTVTPTVSPSVRASPVGQLMAESAAWQRIRETLPAGAAIAMPTWLPASVDRTTVELREVSANPVRYEVVYLSAGRPAVVFVSEPLPLPAVDSGVGIHVRRSGATLNLPQSVFRDPAEPALRRVQWREGDQGLRIESELLRSNDLEQIAWSLDLSTAPPPPFPYLGIRSGVCAASTAEETIRRYVALAGNGSGDATDCYAREVIERSGSGFSNWATQPSATMTQLERRPDVGGRAQVIASWTHVSDPGGPAGQHPTFFFLLGLEEGAYRIFDTATAPLGPHP